MSRPQGKHESIRFDEHSLALLTKLVEGTGWSRNKVVCLLVVGGHNALFPAKETEGSLTALQTLFKAQFAHHATELIAARSLAKTRGAVVRARAVLKKK